MGHSKRKNELEEKYFRGKRQYKKRYKNKKYRYKNWSDKGLFKFLSKSTIHHRRPTSRGGSEGGENKCLKSLLQHAAWHILWENMKPEDILQSIYERTPEEIIEDNPIRKLAFEIIFGYWPTTTNQRIEIALKYWMPEDKSFKKFLPEFLQKIANLPD